MCLIMKVRGLLLIVRKGNDLPGTWGGAGLAIDTFVHILGEDHTCCVSLMPILQALILRNHGLIALGSCVEECFHVMYSLIQACQIQVH